MAQARRQNKRQRGSGGGLPGWAMLTIGLIIGLFVAFLVYLDDMDQPPNAAIQSEESAPEPQAESPDGEDESDSPRFEFYSILPELEVVVPEFGRSSGDDGATPDSGDEGDTTPSLPDETEDDARYFLQAGSFREGAQADRMKAEIALIGLDVSVQDVQINGEPWHRVRVGPYSSATALQAAQQRLRDNEIEFLVMREKTSDG
jgi:hypothetical protein